MLAAKTQDEDAVEAEAKTAAAQEELLLQAPTQKLLWMKIDDRPQR